MRSRAFLAMAIAGGAVAIGGYGGLVYMNRTSTPDGAAAQAKASGGASLPLSAIPAGLSTGAYPPGNPGRSPDPLAAAPTAFRPPSRDIKIPKTSKEFKEEARKQKEAWYAEQGRLDEYRAMEKAREEKKAAKAAERKQRKQEADKRRAEARKRAEDRRSGQVGAGSGARGGLHAPQKTAP